MRWLVDLDTDGLSLEERTYQKAMGIEHGKDLGVDDLFVEDEGETVSGGEHRLLQHFSKMGAPQRALASTGVHDLHCGPTQENKPFRVKDERRRVYALVAAIGFESLALRRENRAEVDPDGGTSESASQEVVTESVTVDPDAALRAAIKAAVDAGDVERAQALLAVLQPKSRASAPNVVALDARRRGGQS